MSYNMQYSPQTSLQTPEQKQMGLFLHISQFANIILLAGADSHSDRYLADTER